MFWAFPTLLVHSVENGKVKYCMKYIDRSKSHCVNYFCSHPRAALHIVFEDRVTMFQLNSREDLALVPFTKLTMHKIFLSDRNLPHCYGLNYVP